MQMIKKRSHKQPRLQVLRKIKKIFFELIITDVLLLLKTGVKIFNATNLIYEQICIEKSVCRKVDSGKLYLHGFIS